MKKKIEKIITEYRYGFAYVVEDGSRISLDEACAKKINEIIDAVNELGLSRKANG